MKELIFADKTKILTDEETDIVRTWVKDNFVPNAFPNAFWHPCVKKEWEKQQKRYALSEEIRKLDRESRGE